MDSAEKEHVKIDKISIEQFRRFENVEFEISKNITLIAGQNGISKSTLLGMLCQPFSFGVHQGRTAGCSKTICVCGKRRKIVKQRCGKKFSG